MSEAKLDKQRLFKLIKGIVMIISLLSIAVGILKLSSINTRQNNMTQICNSKSDNVEYDFKSCNDAINYSENGDTTGFKEIGLGLLLLIVFYSSVGIYKYLHPIT